MIIVRNFWADSTGRKRVTTHDATRAGTSGLSGDRWEARELFQFPPGVAAALRDVFTRSIKSDPNSAMFAGERVLTPFLPRAKFDWHSIHLMTFGDHDQAWHRHFGERCLFIVTEGDCTTFVSEVGPDASLGDVVAGATPVRMPADRAFLFRMQANTWHRFDGRFCALSFHPNDAKGVANIEATLCQRVGVMEAFTAYPKIDLE